MQCRSNIIDTTMSISVFIFVLFHFCFPYCLSFQKFQIIPYPSKGIIIYGWFLKESLIGMAFNCGTQVFFSSLLWDPFCYILLLLPREYDVHTEQQSLGFSFCCICSIVLFFSANIKIDRQIIHQYIYIKIDQRVLAIF